MVVVVVEHYLTTTLSTGIDPDYLGLPKIVYTMYSSTDNDEDNLERFSCPYIPRLVPNTCGFM